MRQIFSLFIALAVAVAFAGVSFAFPKPVERFKDGATDVIMSPKVLKDDVMAETKDKHLRVIPLALVGGVTKGTFYMGKQIVHGAYGMITSPLEITK